MSQEHTHESVKTIVESDIRNYPNSYPNNSNQSSWFQNQYQTERTFQEGQQKK